MPLSEHEQQILDDIEQRLLAEDPRFAEAVSRANLADHLARRLRWSILGFIAGFIGLLSFFFNVWVGAAGFALMVVCTFVFYLAIKQLGQEQLRVMAQNGSLSFSSLIARLVGRMRGDGRDDAADENSDDEGREPGR